MHDSLFNWETVLVAIADLFLALVVLAFGLWGLLGLGPSYLRENGAFFDMSYSQQNAYLWVMVPSGFLTLIAGITASICVTSVLKVLINPDYYTIKLILELL